MADLRGGSTVSGYPILHSGLKNPYIGGELRLGGDVNIDKSQPRINFIHEGVERGRILFHENGNFYFLTRNESNVGSDLILNENRLTIRNVNVGIDTSSPSHKLEVMGDTMIQAATHLPFNIKRTNLSSNVGIRLQNQDNAALYFGMANANEFGFGASGDLNNESVFRINKNSGDITSNGVLRTDKGIVLGRSYTQEDGGMYFNGSEFRVRISGTSWYSLYHTGNLNNQSLTVIPRITGEKPGSDYPTGITLFNSVQSTDNYPSNVASILNISPNNQHRFTQLMFYNGTSSGLIGEIRMRNWRPTEGWSNWVRQWNEVNLPNPARKDIDNDFTANQSVTRLNKSIRVGVGENDVYIHNTASGKFLQLRDNGNFQYDGKVVWLSGNQLDAKNKNITNVNHLTFNDPGVNEGLEWLGGNNWKIYEAPDGLTNSAGNLQFVTGSTRRATIRTDGDFWLLKDFNFNNGHGNGIKFWNSNDYKIYMSATNNSSWGGRITTNSDYHMYFRMAGGTNRGWAFKSANTVVAEIDATGSLRIRGSGRTITSTSTSGSWYRNVHTSTGNPSGGMNGELWVKYK